jgi:hypothetical protein
MQHAPKRISVKAHFRFYDARLPSTPGRPLNIDSGAGRRRHTQSASPDLQGGVG